ncbi:MAG: adenosylhomocysteinase, partial [Candidatus Altiarchaeota archaeon]|nr:adenosylhomocysteinase [Candidatus Altiarchaeota archaeon]
QAMAVKYLTENKLEPRVHKIPDEIDERIAELKLRTMDIQIDQLSERQRKYLESWEEGT